jgi:putative hydrolase of the HAD superfamily
MSVRWVFFDVGSTLVNEEGSHKLRFDEAADDIKKACGRDVTFEEFTSLMYDGAGKRRKSPFHYALRRFGITKIYPYSCDGETVYPEVREVLEHLKQKYKLGIIANQPENLPDRIKSYGLLEYFDAVFGSDDVDLKKPDIEFYRYALRETGCVPGEAVMVGDRLDNDIVPAKKAGMKTIRIMQGYFKTVKAVSEEETPEYTAASLEEIPGILNGL